MEPLSGYRTKIVGYLMLLAAVCKVGIDIFNGGGFDFASNFNELSIGLAGAGFVFLRKAVEKLQ